MSGRVKRGAVSKASVPCRIKKPSTPRNSTVVDAAGVGVTGAGTDGGGGVGVTGTLVVTGATTGSDGAPPEEHATNRSPEAIPPRFVMPAFPSS